MSLFVSKQQYQQQPFNRIESSNSSSTKIQQFNLTMSTEETKQLAGLVAKTRALFESNNTNRFINDRDMQSVRPKGNFTVNRPMRAATHENDSDKENSCFKHQETFAPFLNQLKPTSKLATKFHNLFNQPSSIPSNNTTNSHLPNIAPPQQVNKLSNAKWILNNQQFKAATPLYSSSSCSASSSSSSPPPSSLSSHSFESHHEINDCATIVSSNSPSGLWKVSEELSKEFNLPTSVRQAKMCFERGIQKETCIINQTQPYKSKLNDSPPLYSSSSSNASSSIPSSPTSSLDNSNRFKTILTNSSLKEEKYAYPFNKAKSNSVHLPCLAQVTPSAANTKIKILRKHFSKTSSSNTNFVASQEEKEEVAKSKCVSTYQSQSLDSTEGYESNVTSTASIQIKTFKLKQPEPVVTIKSILRNKTEQAQQPMSSNEPDLSPKLNEKYIKKFLEKTSDNHPAVKVDQSSCVLPSKLKSKNTTNPNEQTVLKLTTNNFKSWQPKTEINTNNLVKNNPFTITNNANNSNMIKRSNKNAATAKENLLRWCRKHTQSYDNVSIDNFSSSWSNGLAFCALIHNFIPDAFDYDLLDPINARRNFELAFKTAEERCDIVSLLDVDDMIIMGNSPDWKCVFTYVHSIYQKFKEPTQSTS